MLFKDEDLKKTLRGEKTMSRRLPGRIIYEIGRVYGIRSGWFKKAEHHILITRRFRQRLGDISLEDVRKEGYRSFDEFRARWTKEYGWNPNRIIIVYEYQLVD